MPGNYPSTWSTESMSAGGRFRIPLWQIDERGRIRIGRVAVSHNLHTPTPGVMGQDRPRVPLGPRAIEHLVGTPSLDVADQDDRQQAILARLVIQGLDRF